MPRTGCYFCRHLFLFKTPFFSVNSSSLRRHSLTLSALVGVAAVLASCSGNTDTKSTKKATTVVAQPGTASTAESRIAYVDIDSLETHYVYFKDKKADFARRQEAMESELQRSAAQLQSEVAAYQKKGQNGGFASQTEVEAAGRRLQQMEQSLATRREALANTLLKDQDAFNKEIQKRLDDFLEGYVKDKPYDYVLSYSKNGSILYANKALDITQDVIEGMNAQLKDAAPKR